MTTTRKRPEINMYQTGQRIKQIMKSRGFSVKDVQNYLGFVTPQSIYHWFRGRNLPTIDNLYSLSELFKVPMDTLLCGNRSCDFDYAIQVPPYRLVLYYENCKVWNI